MACMHVLVNSCFAKNPSTWSWLTPSFCDGGVTPVPDPYGSLTPAELAAFSIDPARVSSDDDDEA
jgi:hypothetical protein